MSDMGTDKDKGATQLAVQDVATACGFADANTFCRADRPHHGTSPDAARSRTKEQARARSGQMRRCAPSASPVKSRLA
jgi:AraC-like DNA-binding protein